MASRNAMASLVSESLVHLRIDAVCDTLHPFLHAWEIPLAIIFCLGVAELVGDRELVGYRWKNDGPGVVMSQTEGSV